MRRHASRRSADERLAIALWAHGAFEHFARPARARRRGQELLAARAAFSRLGGRVDVSEHRPDLEISRREGARVGTRKRGWSLLSASARPSDDEDAEHGAAAASEKVTPRKGGMQRWLVHLFGVYLGSRESKIQWRAKGSHVASAQSTTMPTTMRYQPNGSSPRVRRYLRKVAMTAQATRKETTIPTRRLTPPTCAARTLRAL